MWYESIAGTFIPLESSRIANYDRRLAPIKEQAAMWVISKSKLKRYWESREGKGSREQLEAWHAVVSKAEWQTWSDVKEIYRSADLVGDCVVFNIKGNTFRLIARFRFQSHKVFVLKIMKHSEYDKDDWKTDCGCYMEPPPKKVPVAIKKESTKSKSK